MFREAHAGYESVQNCSDCLPRSIQDVRKGLPGMEADVERFIRCQNVERYRRLLERVTGESDREKILNLLSEERQKQKDAGDPI